MIEDEKNLPVENDLFENWRFLVDKGQSPLRIDKYLMVRIENASRNKIQKAARNDCIKVNNTVVKQNYKVKGSDLIQVFLTQEPKEIEIKPEDIPVPIVYEDDAFIIVNKPANMVVHPAYGNYEHTLVNALMYHFMQENKEHPASPLLVHRIDKNTTGLLVVAKTEQAQTKLAEQFFYHTTKRTYTALVWGDFKEDEGTIDKNVARDIKDRKKMAVFEDSTGKRAITHYKVLERFGYVTLIQCRLETGRTHQIRVHMASIGHPLFNDSTYGGDVILKGNTSSKYKQFIQNCFDIIPRQSLHATTLGFVHPTTSEEVFFTSALPEDLSAVIEKWRKYTNNKGE